MHWFRKGDGTPKACTSAIPEMDFSFGSENPTTLVVERMSKVGEKALLLKGRLKKS